MKQIQLTKGKFALVDDEDFEKLCEVRWCYNGSYSWNASRGSMHRYLLNLPYNKGQRGSKKGQEQVDHINGDKLDNRKENLRVVTLSENQLNHSTTGGKSKYRGVIWAGKQKGLVHKPWISRIKLPGVPRKYLGSFATPEEAARAYDKYALNQCPTYTKLNFTGE